MNHLSVQLIIGIGLSGMQKMPSHTLMHGFYTLGVNGHCEV